MARRIVILANPFPPLRPSVVGGATFNSLDSSSRRIAARARRKLFHDERTKEHAPIRDVGSINPDFPRSNKFSVGTVNKIFVDPRGDLRPRGTCARPNASSLPAIKLPPLASVLLIGSTSRLKPAFPFFSNYLNKSRPVTPTTLDGWSSLEKNGLSIGSLLTWWWTLLIHRG